jgi:DNA-binding XRE family transcriptional regulator
MTEQKTKGGPGDGDIYIGSMIRLARLQSGMSQGSLGAALGLTFQQIQKYERGANRVSAMHLHKISGILSKPIIYFLPEISDRGKPAMGEVGCGVGRFWPSRRRWARGSMPSCTSCGGCFGALCLDLSRGEVRHDL